MYDPIRFSMEEIELDPSFLPTPIVTTKNVTWNSITITWNSVRKALAYKVVILGYKSFYVTKTNSFTKSELPPDTEYCFKVCAMRGRKSSEWSEVVKVRTEMTPHFAECVWRECPDNVDKDRKYSLAKNNSKVVTKIGGDDHASTIVGNAVLPHNKVTSWSIKILKSIDNDGGGIFVGVAPFDIDQNVYNIVSCGWYFNCYYSTLYSGPPHKFKGKDYSPTESDMGYVHTRGSVGVVMDTAKGELSFAINGMNLGVAYEGIPLDKPLIPCVILKEEGDSVELDISEVKETIVDSFIPVPSNIKAKNGSTRDSITLTWDAVEGATSYHIEVDGNMFFDVSETNEFTKASLFLGTMHAFRVRAVKGNEVSKWSDTVKEKTQGEYFESSGWKACPSAVRGRYSVNSRNPRIASNLVGGEQCPIIGKMHFPLNRTITWGIKILSSRNNDGAGIYIGVGPSDIDQNEEKTFEKWGWYFDCSDSTLTSGPPHRYRKHEYGPLKLFKRNIRTGDIVGAVMDTTFGRLSFSVNGKEYGVAYEGISLDKPLAHCVILGNKNDSIELIPYDLKETKLDQSVPVPSNIREESITWDSITITWDAVEGALIYHVKVDENTFWCTSPTNTFTKIGFLTEYTFRVRAVRENGIGKWSDPVKFKTGSIPHFSGCAWKVRPVYVHEKGKYSVDEKNPKIATNVAVNNESCTIIGNAPLPFDKVTSWSIKVLKSNKNDGDRIYIGVAPPDIDQNEDWNYDKCGWYFDCYDSTLHSGPPHGYRWKEYGPRKEKSGQYMHTGDSVGVVMDTTNGELSFVLNGMNLGVAYKGIPLDKPLVPCVILGQGLDSVELDTSEVKENVDKSIPVPFKIEATCGLFCDSLTFNWKAVEGASFYQIEMDGNKSWDISTENSYRKGNLPPSTEHTFRFRVVRGNAVSVWSIVRIGRTVPYGNIYDDAKMEAMLYLKNMLE